MLFSSIDGDNNKLFAYLRNSLAESDFWWNNDHRNSDGRTRLDLKVSIKLKTANILINQ